MSAAPWLFHELSVLHLVQDVISFEVNICMDSSRRESVDFTTTHRSIRIKSSCAIKALKALCIGVTAKIVVMTYPLIGRVTISEVA